MKAGRQWVTDLVDEGHGHDGKVSLTGVLLLYQLHQVAPRFRPYNQDFAFKYTSSFAV